MIPKVDTFHQDIAEEIKRKDASITAISAASNNVGNTPPEEILERPKPVFLIVVISLFAVGLLGMAGLAYFYFTDSLLPPSQAPVVVTPQQVPKVNATLSSLSPTLASQIGIYVTSVEKQPTGYVLVINSYSPVFSYLVRNENSYIEELASVISPVGSSTPVVAKVVPPVVVSTTTASSTKTTTATSSTKTSTSTKVATSTPPPVIVEEPVGPYFKDVTISNQNMRVWTFGKRTVVYAFLTNEKIAVSQTTDGILAIKNAIIR